MADWLEGRLLANRGKHLSRAKVRTQLKNLLFIDGDDLEIQVDLVLQEMARRLDIIGRTYPFQPSPTGMRYFESGETLPYIFLLCISTSKSLRDRSSLTETDVMFDYLVLDALKKYFGKSGQGVRFAWPTTEGRPPDFVQAIAWLSEKMDVPIGRGKQRPKSKDGGVDLVVWKPFKDKKIGFITILAQCTIQVDWFPKRKDIVTDVWQGHLDFGKEPVTSLAIPFVVPSQFDKWDELRRTINLVVDRLRICELLENEDISNRAQLEEWTQKELEMMAKNG